MQTLTFTQKLLRQRRFLNPLIPLLALFVGLIGSQTVSAQGAAANRAFVDVSGTNSAVSFGPNRFFNAGVSPNSSPPRVAFQGQSFGTIKLGSDLLIINNPTLSIVGKTGFETLGNTGRFIFEVFPTTGTRPGSTIVALAKSGIGTGTTNADPAIFTSNTPIDLLAGVTSGGNYTIDISFAIDVTDTDPSGFGTGERITPITKATFTVLAPDVTPPGGTTTWLGGAASGPNNWLIPENWNNGVPSARSNAIIPSPPRANPPILSNSSADYSVKNLTLQVSNPTDAFTTRGIIRVTTAALKIYGNVINGGNGILATTDAQGTEPDLTSASAVIILAGGNQRIDQGRFANLIIQNNDVDQITGAVTPNNTTQVIKSNLGDLDVPGSLIFTDLTKALLRSSVYDLSGNLVLDTGGNESVDLKNTGSIIGETNTAFVLGIVKVERPITAGVKQTFGGVGLDVTVFGSTTAGVGSITRATGATFSPVAFSGATRPVSVKRSFGTSFTGLQTGFNADVVFHYNNNAEELNTNRDGFLSIFRTVSGSTFQRLNGVNTKDPSTYPGNGGTVTALGLNNINTLTLADYELNPLPVRLTAFDAKRVGTDALVTWETASELNSRGYEVQVSTTGKEFRTLASVASAAPNTNRTTQYRYIDTEANKSDTRYYRLRQIDLDGTEAFFNPVAVSFTGKATETALVAYPNPINGNEQLHLTFQSANAGKGQISITDMTGRIVRQQPIDVTTGTTDLAVEQLSDLRTGMYLVRLTLPSGQVQNLKVVKQ